MGGSRAILLGLALGWGGEDAGKQESRSQQKGDRFKNNKLVLSLMI